jgi:hypothetical protein
VDGPKKRAAGHDGAANASGMNPVLSIIKKGRDDGTANTGCPVLVSPFFGETGRERVIRNCGAPRNVSMDRSLSPASGSGLSLVKRGDTDALRMWLRGDGSRRFV